ncbi:MAG: PilZ domain-containing protein [Acidobacteria bacterium]|nr:PilZ domain-containing protein [Acidobacteriota bacterium]
MADFILNERRREARVHGSHVVSAEPPQVPGARVLEVIDVSAHGLRCRLTAPVRPGRLMTLRLATGQYGSSTSTAHVVRCEVCRLTRQGPQYEAAWALERAWRHV